MYVSKNLGGALCMWLCLSWREFETEGQVGHMFTCCIERDNRQSHLKILDPPYKALSLHKWFLCRNDEAPHLIAAVRLSSPT